jgi:hypothetical protein
MDEARSAQRSAHEAQQEIDDAAFARKLQEDWNSEGHGTVGSSGEDVPLLIPVQAVDIEAAASLAGGGGGGCMVGEGVGVHRDAASVGLTTPPRRPAGRQASGVTFGAATVAGGGGGGGAPAPPTRAFTLWHYNGLRNTAGRAPLLVELRVAEFDDGEGGGGPAAPLGRLNSHAAVAAANGADEGDAFKRALAASMEDTGGGGAAPVPAPPPVSRSSEEDEMARAIAASLEPPQLHAVALAAMPATEPNTPSESETPVFADAAAAATPRAAAARLREGARGYPPHKVAVGGDDRCRRARPALPRLAAE